jgi:tRNA-Thr(GGU) m(6)t(6)A37 methyltransferase TsaA
MMKSRDQQRITMKPIGFVRRASPDENERDRSLVAKIVLTTGLAPALDGITEWSHLYVIYWLHQIPPREEPLLHHPSLEGLAQPLGILATRAPIHPNPIGLTLVELLKREENVLWVKGLDALDDTPVLDIKPYPDWEKGRLIVVTNFCVPEWLSNILEDGEKRL